MNLSCIVTALLLLVSLAGAGLAQGDKVKNLILVPASMKDQVDQMPKSLFLGKQSAQTAKSVLGGLDAAKNEPDARFILQLHNLAHLSAKTPIAREINRLEYSLFYRSADPKQVPVLLAKRTMEIGDGNPKTDKTIFGGLAFKLQDDLADALAPKIIDAKAALYVQRLDSLSLVPRNAFPTNPAKNDAGRWEGKVAIKNRLPVSVSISKLAYVTDVYVNTKKPADGPRYFVEFKERPTAAPNESKTVSLRLTDDEGDVILVNLYRYVRIVGLEISEP